MHRLIPSAFLLLASLASVHAQQPSCYRRTNGNTPKKQTSGWIACNNTATHSGGAELCCLSGSECGEDSICRSDSTKTGESRWYVGACTDPTYSDPICRQDCTQYKQTFIVFNPPKWQCCGNSGCDETPNASESFSAIPQSQWSLIPGNAKSTTSPSPNSGGGSSGLNTDAKIAIGFVAGVVGLALIALGAFCYFKKRRPSHKGPKGPKVRGRYEEIGRQLGAMPGGAPFGARETPYGARDSSPQPYGRSTSPIPPARGRDSRYGERDRSRSIGLEERTPLPAAMEESGAGEGLTVPERG